MRWVSNTFTILSTISLLAAVALFIAGSLIFILVQLFHFIFQRGDFLAAFLIVVPTIFLFSYLFLEAIKQMFLKSWEKEKEEKKNALTKKLLFSFLFYEVTRWIFPSRRRN